MASTPERLFCASDARYPAPLAATSLTEAILVSSESSMPSNASRGARIGALVTPFAITGAIVSNRVVFSADFGFFSALGAARAVLPAVLRFFVSVAFPLDWTPSGAAPFSRLLGVVGVAFSFFSFFFFFFSGWGAAAGSGIFPEAMSLFSCS
jgi:hypothetical protein